MRIITEIRKSLSASTFPLQLNRVIDGGFCIGCGICAYATNGALVNRMNIYGQYEARFVNTQSSELLERADIGCPFTNRGPDEDVLSKALFSETAHDERLGYYRSLHAGYVLEKDYRSRGASGGVLSWILAQLLQESLVDGVFHVKPVEKPVDGILFRYQLSRTVEEVRQGSKSRYYPIELSETLAFIKKTEGRYALVGLPCYLKAVRRLCTIDQQLRERIVFLGGLVCGHLKSKAFADSLGWQVGITPGKLQAIDFRHKLTDRPADAYGVHLRSATVDTVRPSDSFAGTNWGMNFFRYKACDFCDDIFAETGDFAVGDAWLPAYQHDSGGTSILVVRHPKIEAIIRRGIAARHLALQDILPDEIANSQAGALRDRREGLAYRLARYQRHGSWVPTKRFGKNKLTLSRQRRRIYRLRTSLGKQSHELWLRAVKLGDLKLYLQGAGAMNKKIYRAYNPLLYRIANRLRGLFFRR